MPYIKDAARFSIDDLVEAGNWPQASNAGELNYIISVIVSDYYSSMGERYQTYNDIMGVLACAQQEVYRRKIAPYEDQKIVENGEVFE